MKTTRIKRSLAPITKDQAEMCLNAIALTTITKQKLVAAKNKALAAVENFHNPGIKLCDASITEDSAKLQSWAEANPTEFGKLKSITWPSGKFGFRTGTPKLCLLNRKWTWGSVLSRLSEAMSTWIRVKEEIDKELVLADYASKEANDTILSHFGMKVEQAETFYIEPAIETVQPRTSQSSNFEIRNSKLPAALVLLCSLCYLLFNSSSEAAQIELQRPVNGIATVIVRQLQFFPYYTHFASLQTSTNLIIWSAPAPTSRDGDTLYYTFTNRPAVYCRLQVSQINYWR